MGQSGTGMAFSQNLFFCFAPFSSSLVGTGFSRRRVKTLVYYATVCEKIKGRRRAFGRWGALGGQFFLKNAGFFRKTGKKVWTKIPFLSMIPINGSFQYIKSFSQVWARLGADLNLNTDFHGLKGFPGFRGEVFFVIFTQIKWNPFNPLNPWKSVFK